MTSLSVCTWNVNGIRKLRQFFSRKRHTVKNPDVLCLQETWAATALEQFSIDDYVAFHGDALPSLGPRPVGGVSTYLRIEAFQSGRLVRVVPPVWWALVVRWIREDEPGIIIINVYAARHTQGVDADEFEAFFDFVQDMRTEHGAEHILIVGDLNADKFRRPRPVVRGEKLIIEWMAKLESEQFKILPDRPVVTYLDAGTTLDYVISSPGLTLDDPGWKVEEALNCQHLPLVATFTVPGTRQSGNLLVPREPNLKFSHESYFAVRELLRECFVDLSGCPTAEHVYSCIADSFYAIGRESHAFPVGNGSSWWKYVPSDLQQQLSELELDGQFLAREWSSGRLLYTMQEVVDFRHELNKVSALCCSLAEAAIMNELREQFPSQALCWKVLRKLRSPESSVAIDIGTLQQHFSKIFHRRDRPVLVTAPDEDLGVGEGWGETRSSERHLDEPFSDAELLRALKELNGQAGTGPERIPSQTIKDVFADEEVRPILLLLMNICFQEGVVPTAWGMAELFVLFKGKGLPTLADNYRAIALSNDFRRVYERLIQARLASWSRMNNGTGSMQFGFKTGSGTLEAIFVLRTFMLYVTRVMKVPGFAIFIDMKKAFPSISRPKIVEVLKKKRVPWKVTRAVGSLLSGSMQRLRVNGKLTPAFPVTSGTPEGSINSPELFAIVYRDLLDELDIHELPEDLSKIEHGKVYYIVFADDLSFFSLDVELLQVRAEEFETRARVYDMLFNAGKTKWMAFLPESFPDEPLDVSKWKITISGETVENVDEFVYLGYRLDAALSDEAHVKMVNERFIKAAIVTGRLMNELRCVNLVNLRRFFVSLVFSQLYGLIFVDKNKIEFDRGVGIFLRASLGLPCSFPHVVAAACLGIKPIRVFQMEQRVKFMARWENGERYPVFEMLYGDRVELFPGKVGLNARLGGVLESMDLLVTIDYTTHYQSIMQALQSRANAEHRGRLLATEGRAFWTELSPDGYLCADLKLVLSRLSHESLRVFILFAADMLCWTALKQPTRLCRVCSVKFTSAHFFTCPQLFLQERGWAVLVGLIQAESWVDMVDFVFDVLRRWVTETSIFKENFRLQVLEQNILCGDVDHVAFRWTV